METETLVTAECEPATYEFVVGPGRVLQLPEALMDAAAKHGRTLVAMAITASQVRVTFDGPIDQQTIVDALVVRLDGKHVESGMEIGAGRDGTVRCRLCGRPYVAA